MEDQLAYLIATLNRSMRELASLVLVDPSSLTKIVDRMVTESLVYRAVAPNDRRRILIFLAPKGKALKNKLKGVLGKQQRNLVGRLDLPNAKQLDRILRQLKGRIQAP
jgi:MarR family transcriptional regulator, organic hydroperoxide resistance regulator